MPLSFVLQLFVPLAALLVLLCASIVVDRGRFIRSFAALRILWGALSIAAMVVWWRSLGELLAHELERRCSDFADRLHVTVIVLPGLALALAVIAAMFVFSFVRRHRFQNQAHRWWGILLFAWIVVALVAQRAVRDDERKGCELYEADTQRAA